MPDVSDAPATISVTEDDAGNLDVSVHVLTPVETTTTSEDTGDPALVSAQPTGSITPTQDTHEAAQQDETTAPPPAGTNVNDNVTLPGTGSQATRPESCLPSLSSRKSGWPSVPCVIAAFTWSVCV